MVCPVVPIRRLLAGPHHPGSQGGVFATFARSEFQISLSFFYNNHAGVEGGVIYMRNINSSVIIDHTQLGFNSAAKNGGVVSINRSTLSSDNSPIFNNSADLGAVISACTSDVFFFPPNMLYQYSDPNFPNGLHYDVTENRPSTEAVTTPTIPPTGAHWSYTLRCWHCCCYCACLVVVVLFIAALLICAYYPKCK